MNQSRLLPSIMSALMKPHISKDFTERLANLRRLFHDVHHPRHSESHSWYASIILLRQKPLLQRIGYFVRLVRIPIVAAGIFSLGFHQGVIESQRNPQHFQQQLLDAVIKESYPEGQAEVETISVSEIEIWRKKWTRTETRNLQVANVAAKILDQAKIHIQKELQNAKQESKFKIIAASPANLSDKELTQKIEKSPEVEKWEAAKWRVIGSDLDTEPWRFVFVTGPSPNAWVTELLPKRLFIATSLLDFAESIDEVAFVLSHELSHFIHGHVSRFNEIEKNLKTAEILLLTMDPTEGVLAFGVIAFLDIVRRAIAASYSRDQEHEADELGMHLLRACEEFDMEAGSRLLYRLHRVEGKSAMPFLDTHPPSLERARFLYAASKELTKST